jgi:glucosylceramidase
MFRIVVATIAVVAVSTVTAGPAAAHDTSVITVSDHGHQQSIDGFGMATAFDRVTLLAGLSAQQQNEIYKLWFDRTAGAGLSIMRLGIGSSPLGSPYDKMISIEPNSPGSPDAPPQYIWDGKDNGQVQAAKIAQSYGVRRFYADAWSAPAFMKTNANENNGGMVAPEWEAAYARYLVQYTKFYAQEGVRITDLGFTNEPDFTASYASMRYTPAQAAEFIKVLGPAARGTGVHLTCCDSFGWDQAKAYTSAIEADPQAAHFVKTFTGHGYASPVTSPQPTDSHTWMTEWNPNGTTWNENWDDNSGYDGFAVAQNIMNSLTLGNVSAYVYWVGDSLGATRALIQIDQTNQTFHVSKRLWALAAFSRFIRPGAVRLNTTVTDPALQVSAFRNDNGSTVVEVLNTGTTPIAWHGVDGHATSYLTDSTNSLAPSPVIGRTVTLQPRALTTIVTDDRR